MSAFEHGEAAPTGETSSDIRPIVAGRATNRSLWAFAVILLLGGFLLFRALETRREAITAPATVAGPDATSGMIASPPELTIPSQPAQTWSYGEGWQPPRPLALPAGAVTAPVPVERSTQSPIYTTPTTFAPSPAQAAENQASWPAPSVPPPPSGWNSGAGRTGTPDAPGGQNGKERVEARRFANPATTVPKGTVLQAVLESALDSTRGGFARAIVSRDIYSFDGSRVLIQRGSRIIGEYKSDVTLGQKRLLIQWQRLMRPDGVMIDLDSPSADPLGRAGVGGTVNTHFFERFAGAILQSSLDIGVQLAARAASHDTVVLALPGGVQQTGQALQPERIPPTVKVRQGTSVSVFVARDLDFTGV